MASADDLDPRILSELARHLTLSKSNQKHVPPGMPEDYSFGVYRSKDAPDSQTEMSIPEDLESLYGEIAWTNHDYLRRLDLHLLRQNIQRYQRLSSKLLDRPAIRRELLKALKAPGVGSVVIPFRHFSLPAGVPLYRARRIDNVDQVKEWKDIWTAPPSFIGAGRVNDVGEPLLYTASDPLTALYEIHAEPGDLVAMSLFRSTRRIIAVDMAEDITVRNLGRGDQRKLAMIMKFLIGIFSQKVPSSEPFRSIAPDLVAKEIFNPYPDIYAGWCYRSVADPRGLPLSKNLALRASTARGLIDYKFTQVVRINSDLGPVGEHKVVTLLEKSTSSDKLTFVSSAVG